VDRQRPSISVVQSLAIASQFGITLAVSVVLGYFVGQWLDTQLHTGIIFTLIGVLLGLVAAATSTVRIYRAFLRGATTRSARPPADEGEANQR
jgi:F0F1-type ATP synthase assembly protein I